MGLKRLQSVLTVCLCLGGCATADEARDVMDQYTGTPVAAYTNSAGRWEIYDKSGEGRLKIAQNSTIANPASAAFGRAVTFGDLPRGEYQNAVEGWLVGTGRMCTITDGTPIIVSQWEFKYSCR